MKKVVLFILLAYFSYIESLCRFPGEGFNSVTEPNKIYQANDRALYKCVDHYKHFYDDSSVMSMLTLLGSNHSKCLNNGFWSHVPPVCVGNLKVTLKDYTLNVEHSNLTDGNMSTFYPFRKISSPIELNTNHLKLDPSMYVRYEGILVHLLIKANASFNIHTFTVKLVYSNYRSNTSPCLSTTHHKVYPLSSNLTAVVFWCSFKYTAPTLQVNMIGKWRGDVDIINVYFTASQYTDCGQVEQRLGCFNDVLEGSYKKGATGIRMKRVEYKTVTGELVSTLVCEGGYWSRRAPDNCTVVHVPNFDTLKYTYARDIIKDLSNNVTQIQCEEDTHPLWSKILIQSVLGLTMLLTILKGLHLHKKVNRLASGKKTPEEYTLKNEKKSEWD